MFTGGKLMLKEILKQCGLIAILRGIRPDEIEATGKVLYDVGFRVIEVPLNSPEPFESIRILRKVLPVNCIVGAGTVLSPAQVQQVRDAEGQLIVMPHSDPEIIRTATAAGLASAPGVATVTEAFAALAAGADILKMFPAEQLGPQVVKAWRAVIPASVMLVPVGGITPASLKEFTVAGASAFGLGSALYKPGMTAAQIRLNAEAFLNAWRQL